MVVKQAVAGNAFDVNQILNATQAKSFADAGYTACIRYIPRNAALLAGNLTGEEIDILLEQNLSVGVVQHCAIPGWLPSAGLGNLYGSFAAQYAIEIGLPKGMQLWLDLETPSATATTEACIAYANAWFSAVQGGGYLPAVYVGYGLPLSPAQLHDDLSCKAYWRAYNGPDVAGRGYCIVQHTAKVLNGVSFDPNTVAADNDGGMPMFLSNS